MYSVLLIIAHSICTYRHPICPDSQQESVLVLTSHGREQLPMVRELQIKKDVPWGGVSELSYRTG